MAHLIEYGRPHLFAGGVSAARGMVAHNASISVAVGRRLAGGTFSGQNIGMVARTNVLICSMCRLDLLEQFPSPPDGSHPDALRHTLHLIIFGLEGRFSCGEICDT